MPRGIYDRSKSKPRKKHSEETKRKINKRKNKKIFLKTFPKNLYKPNIMCYNILC